MICKQCGKTFTEKYSKWSNGNFCCKHCAKVYASNIKRKEINKKVSKALKGRIIGGINHYNTTVEEIKKQYYKNPKRCIICNKILKYEQRKYKTCCQECKNKQIHNKLKAIPVKIGGYVPKSCRGKHGWYKGIYYDSTYELAYVIYCLDHNIPIKRCEEVFEYQIDGKTHHYHPDFVVNDEIIEIKNYYREINDIKLKSINKPCKILYYNDLIPIFEYVSKTYNKKFINKRNNFHELYDAEVVQW